MNEFLNMLHEWDVELFLFLNSFHNPFLDQVMYYASERLTWVPLYAFLLYFFIKEYGKRAYLMVFMVIILILLADQISVYLKNHFERPRPCHELLLKGWVHLVRDKCGGKFGFVSSHAANTFALAFYVVMLRGTMNHWLSIVMICYAVFVSFSRIYLSAHYPGDVLAGAFLGFLCSLFTWCLFCIFETKISEKIKLN
jgi:undecaprenyl-diphosphatase